MSGPIAVHSSLESYRVAAAELPVSTRIADELAGAIAVVDGAGEWWDAASRALEQKAVGIVVSRPRAAPSDALDALAAAAEDRPIILERPLLRADIEGSIAATLEHRPAHSALVIECHAPSMALDGALRDAIGWARVLARAPLELRSAASARGRGLALLDAAGGAPVTLIFAAQPGAPTSGRIRVTSLGISLVELDGDEGDMAVTMTDVASRRVAPARFERPERLALRRAVEAVAGDARTPDLAALALDATLARAVLDASSS